MKAHPMPVLSEQDRKIITDTCDHMISRSDTSEHSANLRVVAQIALASITAEPYGYVAESPCSSGYGGMMHEFSIDRRDVEEDAAEHEGFVITLYASPPVPVKQEGEQS